MIGLPKPPMTFAHMNFLPKFGQNIKVEHLYSFLSDDRLAFQRKGLKEEKGYVYAINRIRKVNLLKWRLTLMPPDIILHTEDENGGS